MTTTGHTVLITGGGSGIGFELAKKMSEQNNRVIIAGRNESKLKGAAAQLKNTEAVVCDVTVEEEVHRLVAHIRNRYGRLTVLVNNAGIAKPYTLNENAGAFEQAASEMLTNYLAAVRLTESCLPLLQAEVEAAIINIGSVVAFAPAAVLPTYSASKAALHSYTQSLRYTHAATAPQIRVFEVMPPLVDTAFSKALPGNKMHPADVAEAILQGLENDVQEMHLGQTADLYRLYLQSPQAAMQALNGTRQQKLATETA